MTQNMLVVDPKKCTGCRACLLACSLHQEQVCNPNRSRVRVIDLEEPGTEPGVYLPVVCQQCEDAPCAKACPRQAVSRDPDLMRMVIDYGLCVGCGMCVHACPFGATGFDEDRGRPFKCDLCQGDPMCVQFCEPGALRYVDARQVPYQRARAAARQTAGARR